MDNAGRVLLVDDEPDIRDAMADFLAAEVPGLQVATADGALKAMQQLMDHGADVLVTDFRMPGIDGVGLIERVRDAGIDVEIIMATAYPDLDLAMKTVNDLEIRNFVNKPIDPERLLKMVVKALHRVQTRRLRDADLVGHFST